MDGAKILAGIERIQGLLPREGEGKYAVGNEFTIADAAIVPFIARLDLVLDLVKAKAAKDVLTTLKEDKKYARFRTYVQDVKGRESFKKTWDEVCLLLLFFPNLDVTFVLCRLSSARDSPRCSRKPERSGSIVILVR